jgi:hypothetical protein
LDGADYRIYEAKLATLQEDTEAPYVGTFPSHILVDGAFVYVTSNGDGTLQVLQALGPAADAGAYVTAPLDGGLGLQTVAVLPLPAGGAPEYMTKLGTNLFITLYGTGAVAQVDVSNPLEPALVNAYDLTQLNLNTFPGAPIAPAPWGITTFQDQVYVAMQNSYYDPGSGSVLLSGDGGLIAVINPSTGTLSEVDLGSDVCLEPTWLLPSADGTGLFVTCAGHVTTSGAPHYNTQSVDRGAVVAVNASNQRVATWSCATMGADSGCGSFSPNVFAVRGSRLYVGDNSYGRVLVLDTQGGGLTEVAGFSSGKGPLQACPVNAQGNANISYVLSVP